MTHRLRQSVPAFSQAPKQYSQPWADELVKQLTLAIQQMYNPAAIRAGGLTLTNLPELGHGLFAGDVYSDAGVLRVVRATDAFAPSLVANGFLGTVTTS